MIETTGLADPAPVAFTFYINQEVQDFYKIDSILTLVDCKHVKEHLDEDSGAIGSEGESPESTGDTPQIKPCMVCTKPK